MVFDLPVTEEKVKSHQITALHLIVALALFTSGALFYFMYLLFAYTIYKETSEHTLQIVRMEGVIVAVLGILLFAVIVAKNKWLVKSANNRIIRIGELLVVACISIYAFIVNMPIPGSTFAILGAVLIFSLYWEATAGKPAFVHIDEQGIRLPSTSRKRSLEWWEVDQVMLRYGTLSIECMENRLYQLNINPVQFDMKQFDAFCEGRISESADKRKNNEW